MSESLVKQYYTTQVRKEWRRLVKDPYHRLELDTTLHFLDKYLPERGLVLDAGGGPGRYTHELARRGHDVILLDLTPANLAFARRQIKKANISCWYAEKWRKNVFNCHPFDLLECHRGQREGHQA